MKKYNNHYTLIFVPEDNRKTFTLRIPKYVLHSLLLFFIIFFSGLVLLLYKSGEIAAKLQVLSLIRMENDKLSKENENLRLITDKIHRLDQLSNYLHRLSAVPGSRASTIYAERSISVSDIIYNSEPSSNPQVTSKKSKTIGSFPNIPPVEGWITRRFQEGSGTGNTGHRGIDFAATLGTPIKATAPGVVGKIENDKYFGLLLAIHHENGFVTRYGHCSQILVGVHDRVKRGQTVALVGNTGRSTAPHLHYEMIKDGKYIDPSKHILVHKDQY